MYTKHIIALHYFDAVKIYLMLMQNDWQQWPQI